MTAETPSPQQLKDDLAFMRALVEDSGPSQRIAGALFLAGGLAYGLQVLLQSFQVFGWLDLSPLANLALSLSGTVLFLAILSVVLWRNRKAPQGGTGARAINAAFAAIGLTNIVMVLIIGRLALHLKSISVWELYPALVFALQGAAWLISFLVKRRRWHLLVAAGWTLTALAMGWWIGSSAYVLICGVGLIAWMAIPGLIMMRHAQPSTAGAA
jgi:hypothetical protein